MITWIQSYDHQEKISSFLPALCKFEILNQYQQYQRLPQVHLVLNLAQLRARCCKHLIRPQKQRGGRRKIAWRNREGIGKKSFKVLAAWHVPALPLCLYAMRIEKLSFRQGQQQLALELRWPHIAFEFPPRDAPFYIAIQYRILHCSDSKNKLVVMDVDLGLVNLDRRCFNVGHW